MELICAGRQNELFIRLTKNVSLFGQWYANIYLGYHPPTSVLVCQSNIQLTVSKNTQEIRRMLILIWITRHKQEIKQWNSKINISEMSIAQPMDCNFSGFSVTTLENLNLSVFPAIPTSFPMQMRGFQQKTSMHKRRTWRSDVKANVILSCDSSKPRDSHLNIEKVDLSSDFFFIFAQFRDKNSNEAEWKMQKKQLNSLRFAENWWLGQCCALETPTIEVLLCERHRRKFCKTATY